MTSIISRLIQASALHIVAVRGGIVALNFGIMIGLAAYLGLSAFGALAVIWSLSLIASTALSLGGPLLLLSRLNDGTGLSWTGIILHVLIGPAVVAMIAFPVLQLVLPAQPWAAILVAGFAINLVSCLASIMRALGSVQMSMALRDAGPMIALGIAGVMGAGAGQIILQAALWLGVLAACAAVWCLCHDNRRQMIRRNGATPAINWGLWGTGVLGMALAQIDIVIGGSFLSAEHIGFYALLRRVTNLVALPVSVATWVSAGPVTAAFAAKDDIGLRQAAASGSQIALIPGIVLFTGAIAAIPLLDVLTGQTGGRATFAVLALGALVQVIFASGFTVATLCGQARAAALVRGASIGLYLVLVATVTPAEMIGNAGIYVIALSAGSILLWAILHQRMGVDTSAAALRSRKAGAWSFS